MRSSSKTAVADKAWFHYLVEHSIASSGHGGSLAGMRKMFWGRDALVVRCWGYLFLVSDEVFKRVTGGD